MSFSLFLKIALISVTDNTVTNMNFSCHIMRQAIFKFQLTPPPNYVMKKKERKQFETHPSSVSMRPAALKF